MLKANRDEIVADIGGETELSHVKSALIERFCWLEAILQDLEIGMAGGEIAKADALSKWIQGVNSLSGLAKVLGVERRMKTVDLKTYVAAEAKHNGQK